MPAGELFTMPVRSSYMTIAIPEEGTIRLISSRPSELDIGFEVSPEIYHLYYVPEKKSGQKETFAPPVIVRGQHAHKIKQELFTALSGKLEIHLKDGRESSIVAIDRPDESLYVPSGLWHEVHFHEPAILQVISSTRYSPEERKNDYIEHYRDYLDWKKI